MDLANRRCLCHLGIGDDNGKEVGWSGRKKVFRCRNKRKHGTTLFGALGSHNYTFGKADNTSLRMPQGGTTVSLFKDEKLKHRIAWGHIYFCDTARNRMCLLNPTPASLTQYCCSLLQWWEEIQAQGRKKNEKACRKVNWGHILVLKYTWQIILAFFLLFSLAVCVYLLLKRLAGSAGAQVNVDSRVSCGPGKPTLHLSGGLPRTHVKADSSWICAEPSWLSLTSIIRRTKDISGIPSRSSRTVWVLASAQIFCNGLKEKALWNVNEQN